MMGRLINGLYNVLIYSGEYLDILAISCDSFNEDTNFTIGRCQDGKNHLSSLKAVRNWCDQYRVAFKINTVVNTHNWKEDMAEEILELNPIRWKVRYGILVRWRCQNDHVWLAFSLFLLHVFFFFCNWKLIIP